MPSLRQDPHGTYFIDYRADGKRVRESLGTKDRAKAEADYADLVARLDHAQPDKTAHGLADLRRVYLELHLVGRSRDTRENARRALVLFEQWCAERRITALTDMPPDAMLVYHAWLLGRGLAVMSARTYLLVLKAAWRRCGLAAVEWPRLRVEHKEIEVFTAAQVAEVFDAVDRYAPEIAPVVRFIAATGWRISDVLTLEHGHVDIPRRRAVRRQTKTGRGLGVRLNVDALRAVADAATHTGLVFPYQPGRPWTRSNLRHHLSGACRKAGITYRVYPHKFRHTLATRLASEGAPIAVVQHLLGHASPNTTFGKYQHFWPGAEVDWIDGYQADGQNRGQNVGGAERK